MANEIGSYKWLLTHVSQDPDHHAINTPFLQALGVQGKPWSWATDGHVIAWVEHEIPECSRRMDDTTAPNMAYVWNLYFGMGASWEHSCAIKSLSQWIKNVIEGRRTAKRMRVSEAPCLIGEIAFDAVLIKRVLTGRALRGADVTLGVYVESLQRGKPLDEYPTGVLKIQGVGWGAIIASRRQSRGGEIPVFSDQMR